MSVYFQADAQELPNPSMPRASLVLVVAPLVAAQQYGCIFCIPSSHRHVVALMGIDNLDVEDCSPPCQMRGIAAVNIPDKFNQAAKKNLDIALLTVEDSVEYTQEVCGIKSGFFVWFVLMCSFINTEMNWSVSCTFINTTRFIHCALRWKTSHQNQRTLASQLAGAAQKDVSCFCQKI